MFLISVKRCGVRGKYKENGNHFEFHACTTCSLVICCPVARSTFGLLFSDCATAPDADAATVVAAAVIDCDVGDDC